MIGLLEFDAEMARLEQFTGKKLSKEQLAIWFEKIKHVDAKVFREAIDAQLETGRVGGQFPTIGDVRAAIDRARGSRANLGDYFPSRKDVARISARDSEYTKAAKELFDKAASRKLTGGDLADEMFAMENKYPGRGWFENACEVLKRSNDRLGIQTDEVYLPKNQGSGIRVGNCERNGCNNPGTMSPFTGEKAPWFCREHI